MFSFNSAWCSLYIYILLCFVFWPYTVIHGISYYTSLFPSRTHEQTQANTSTVRATDFHLFCMFDSHLKTWTNEIEKTKPQYIPIPILDHHWLYFPYLKYIQTLPSQSFAFLFSTSFCSLSQNNFAAISHFCATRMLLVRTWTVLAILHERPVASSAIWVAKRAGLRMYSPSLTLFNCTARSCEWNLGVKTKKQRRRPKHCCAHM